MSHVICADIFTKDNDIKGAVVSLVRTACWVRSQIIWGLREWHGIKFKQACYRGHLWMPAIMDLMPWVIGLLSYRKKEGNLEMRKNILRTRAAFTCATVATTLLTVQLTANTHNGSTLIEPALIQHILILLKGIYVKILNKFCCYLEDADICLTWHGRNICISFISEWETKLNQTWETAGIEKAWKGKNKR